MSALSALYAALPAASRQVVITLTHTTLITQRSGGFSITTDLSDSEYLFIHLKTKNHMVSDKMSED